MEKPGLALLITKAMAKKRGKEEDEDEYKSDDEEMDQLKDISRDLLDAIKADDEEAVASLLKEAFECCDAAPHMEGPHEEE